MTDKTVMSAFLGCSSYPIRCTSWRRFSQTKSRGTVVALAISKSIIEAQSGAVEAIRPQRGEGPAYASPFQASQLRCRFTALVAFNDISALGAMTALREAGHKVPEDVSIMGFDDIEFASIAFPALTTIRQPLHEMGTIAAELLLGKLANDERVRNVRVRPELIVRSSTCPTSSARAKGRREGVRGPR